MTANDDRLERIELKLDKLALSVEHRVTKLESAAKTAGALWGAIVALIVSLGAAWFGRHS